MVLPQVLCDTVLYRGTVWLFAVFVYLRDWRIGRRDYTQYFGSFLKDENGTSSSFLETHSPQEGYGTLFLVSDYRLETSTWLLCLLWLTSPESFEEDYAMIIWYVKWDSIKRLWEMRGSLTVLYMSPNWQRNPEVKEYF